MVMIIKFPIFLYNCPKLQKKDRKLTKNQRKKLPLSEINKIEGEYGR